MAVITQNNHYVSLSNLLLKKLLTPSVFAIITIIIFSLLTFKYWVFWEDHPFKGDIDQYYSYLVAKFIHHDFSFHFPHHFWLIETPTGNHVPKVTMGVAILYLPFFVIADNIAYAFDYDPLGYSAPYGWCIHFGTLLYVIIGFWYLRKTLLLFFNEWITALTILLVLFATNLFHYTFREGEMAHSYLFFLFSVFMYHTIKWHHTKKNKHLYYFSFIAGFIALIRPTDALVVLIPLLYQVTDLKSLKEKVSLIINLKWKLVIVITLFILPILPQLIFWKIYSGQFFFFSYGSNERFFFTDPKIYSVLFGWHKGFFIYAPIALLMMIGLMLMFFKWKQLAYAITVYFIINVYLISCWWDWGFGGAYGMRALVQSFAILAIPLAFFFQWLSTIKLKWLKLSGISISLALAVFCCALNVFNARQFKNYLFHWDGMTKEAYKFVFFRMDATKEERDYLETLFKSPNYEEMRKGNRDE